MTPSFRQAAIVGSSLCLALAAVWMGAPQFILWVWQTNGSDSTLLMARRGAALFLGLAVMLWLTRNAESSPAGHAIAVGFSVSCAALGMYDFVAGHAGVGILAAAAVEAMLALTFAIVRHAVTFLLLTRVLSSWI
jgi:hypothetical protein